MHFSLNFPKRVKNARFQNQTEKHLFTKCTFEMPIHNEMICSNMSRFCFHRYNLRNAKKGRKNQQRENLMNTPIL